MAHAHDARSTPPIETYLIELGLVDPQQNHATFYKTSFVGPGPTRGRLPATIIMHGAIQSALGQRGHEMVRFNLGYEHLPYHLHVIAYELDELGIDPYYFTVCIRVDNAASGHAR